MKNLCRIQWQTLEWQRQADVAQLVEQLIRNVFGPILTYCNRLHHLTVTAI
jgi:hypothetical protein